MTPLTHSPLRRWVLRLVITAIVVIVLWPTSRPAAAAVTLIYFDAHWQADVETVVMMWETGSEIDAAGFQLERSTSPDSGFAPINGGAVYAPEGDPLTGALYGPYGDDVPPPNGATYWYRLVEIAQDNTRNPLAKMAVLIGNENTVTPTGAPATPTNTPTCTPTPQGTSTVVAVNLLPAYSQLQAFVGQSVTQTLRLTNVGNALSVISLAYYSSAYDVLVSPVIVGLPAGIGVDIQVRINVPADPEMVRNTVNIVATSNGNGIPLAVAQVIAIVERRIYLPIMIHQ